MLELLRNWKGTVEVNGTVYASINAVNPSIFASSDSINIKLHPVKAEASRHTTERIDDTQSEQIRISVKQYMTRKATPEFDFMERWNNNQPMPLRTMIGEKVKETRGMVYMKLHGDIYAEKICTCMKCGRALTNPVSQYFGIGPECGGHNYVNPFDDAEQLKEAVADYRKQLQSVTWEGWIIKSAITEEEAVA